MVCEFLRLQHPGVMFHTDYAAGVKLTKGQAVKNKMLQSGRAWPDLFIPEPRNGKAGLFLEIKADDATVFLKSGQLSSDEHIQEQAEVLEKLRSRGFETHFAKGFDQARGLIDTYLMGGVGDNSTPNAC